MARRRAEADENRKGYAHQYAFYFKNALLPDEFDIAKFPRPPKKVNVDDCPEIVMCLVACVKKPVEEFSDLAGEDDLLMPDIAAMFLNFCEGCPLINTNLKSADVSAPYSNAKKLHKAKMDSVASRKLAQAFGIHVLQPALGKSSRGKAMDTVRDKVFVYNKSGTVR